eukprot:403356192
MFQQYILQKWRKMQKLRLEKSLQNSDSKYQNEVDDNLQQIKIKALQYYQKQQSNKVEKRSKFKTKRKIRKLKKKYALIREILKVRVDKILQNTNANTALPNIKDVQKPQNQQKFDESDNRNLQDQKYQSLMRIVEQRKKWDKFIMKKVPNDQLFKKELLSKYLIPNKEIEPPKYPTLNWQYYLDIPKSD